MKTAILCAALLCLSACGGASSPKGRPKFQPGAQVVVGPFEVQGQVVASDCASDPCRYEVRYLPPSGEDRAFRRETFEEVELKPYAGSGRESLDRRR